MSCPRTVTWPVLKHGWSFALTGHHVLYDICMSWETWWLFANVQLVSLLSVWILHFVGLFHNIVHHTICKVCASIVNKAAVPLLCKLIVVFVWLFMMTLLLIFEFSHTRWPSTEYFVEKKSAKTRGSIFHFVTNALPSLPTG